MVSISISDFDNCTEIIQLIGQKRLTMRAADGGYAPRFLSVCVAMGFPRFESESTLPPTAANARRWVANTMKKLLRKTLTVLILCLIIVSCDRVGTIQSSPTEEMKSTATVFPSATIAATSTLIVTPHPTTLARATIEAFDSLCIGAKEISKAELSPNGQWIAALCYWENGKEESPLQVVSIDHSKEWKIYYRDFSKDGPGDRKDGIMPYRWSKDGKYLYAVAGSRESGCCWTGGKYVLLVRLNLETGEQLELLNSTDYGTDLPISFSMPESDRYLLFTPTTEQSYDFSILDLASGATKVVKLDTQKPVNLEYAVMSPHDDKIVLPLYRLVDFLFVIDSIVLIDLVLNEQRILIADLKEGDELYQIRWIDKEHVLISNMIPGDWIGKPEAVYWSLDINTGEREKVENP